MSDRPPVKRHHWIVRLTHWANAMLLVGMIASGLQIYSAFPHFGPRGGPYPLPNPWDGKPFPHWARLGGWLAGGLNWHFALAWPFVLTGLVYLALSRRLGRVALAPVPAARRPARAADAALLPAPAPGAPAAGEAQRAPEGAPIPSSWLWAPSRC